MRAGKLRDRITIQQLSETQDSFGQPIRTWSDLITIWGHVQDLQGKGTITAGQVQATLTHSIVIRGLGAIVLSPARHRVVSGGVKFAINYIPDDYGDGRQFTIYCTSLAT